MSFSKNDVTIRGYVNFLTVQQFSSGDFSLRFSMTLSAGKTADGNYRKEYINVQLGSDLSKEIQGRFKDGDFIQVEGRLRNQQYEKNGEKKNLAFVEGFSAFLLKRGQPVQQQMQQQQAPMVPNVNMQQAPMQQAPMHHQQNWQQQQQNQMDLDGIPF